MAHPLATSNLLKEISMNRSMPQRLTKELDEWGFADKKLQCGNDVSMTKNLISQIQQLICLMKTDFPTDMLDRLELIGDRIKDGLIKKDFHTLHSELLWIFVKHQVEVALTDDIKKQEKRDNEILLKFSDRSQLWEKYGILELECLEFKDKNEKLILKCKELECKDQKKLAIGNRVMDRVKEVENNISTLKNKLELSENHNISLLEELDAIKSTHVDNSQFNHKEGALLTSLTNKVLEQENIISKLEQTNLLNKSQYLKTMKYFSEKSSEGMQAYNTILENERN